MAGLESDFSLIHSAFPGCEALIERGLESDPGFREACEDYRRCFAARNRWNDQEGPGASCRVREYDDLLAELREEIGIALGTLARTPFDTP